MTDARTKLSRMLLCRARVASRRARFLIASATLLLALTAAAPVGAALPAKRHRKHTSIPKQTSASKATAAARRKSAIAKYLAARAAATPATTPKKKGVKSSKAFQRGVAAKLRAEHRAGVTATRKKTTVRRRTRAPASTTPKKRVAKKHTAALSLPELALIAIAPFGFMAFYLLGLDRRRRRVPVRRRASLVITPVRGRH